VDRRPCRILRGPRDSDVDDRLRHPIDPGEEDGYGSAWRREWDGRRYHTREHLIAWVTNSPPDPRTYTWMVEHDRHCIGSTGLKVNPEGREVTRLVLAWAFDVLGVHRVELQALASNSRAINCYLACGFRQEGVRREAELYPDGWKDFIMTVVFRPFRHGCGTVGPATGPSRSHQEVAGNSWSRSCQKACARSKTAVVSAAVTGAGPFLTTTHPYCVDQRKHG
jgi:RimJ/RimL family protein N-acetyltransferase